VVNFDSALRAAQLLRATHLPQLCAIFQPTVFSPTSRRAEFVLDSRTITVGYKATYRAA
jgi:hypothetical protein